MNPYVGTSGYSYKEWKGSFYPQDLPAKRMLHHYSEHFRAVEINSTFYSLPKASVLEAWAAEVPKDFKFILKAPQQITHRQRLKDSGDSVQQLLEVAQAYPNSSVAGSAMLARSVGGSRRRSARPRRCFPTPARSSTAR